ncbi:ABC transporter substrate-binding protein [Thermococcus thermotolerans]|uniref:ABC transporter substrate-binding protein n=1 Tax=Thermococcus thermotolerans TaxID=2969672 RepID=UPI0021582BA4|nr:ABC transporter substrate-binding protein [Thermococcus thermotolerans]
MLFSIFSVHAVSAADYTPKDIPLNSDEAKARFKADLQWYLQYGHFVISNGPYMLVMYSPENLYLKLEKFTGARTIYTNTLPKDGYADVIEYQGVQNPENVILQIAKGEYDLGMFSFPAGKYQGLGADVLANLNLYKSASSYNELTFNTYHDPDKDAPLVTVGDQVYFNPFAIREVRFAMNFLVSRDYIVQNIYQGSGAPMLGCIRPSHPADKYFEPVYKALGITGAGNEQLALQMIDQAMQKAAQEVANYGHTLEKKDGMWYFDGQPVTVKFIIRIEDERKEIGLYVADLLEKKVGFKVDRLLWDRQKAGQVVFAKPPSNYEWNIYTGGWGTSGIPSVWIDDYTAWFYASWYGYVPGAVEPKHVNTVTVEEALKYIGNGDVNAGLQKIGAEYYTNSDKLGPMLKWTEEELTYLLTYFVISKDAVQGTPHINADLVPTDPIKITTKEQYWDLQKISMLIGVLESARVFMIETWEFYPANKQRVVKIVPEASTGIGQRWSIMTAQTPDKHLKIAQFASTGAMFMSAFNPVGGLNDVYSVRVWNLIRDYGATTNFDGIVTPYRCKWTLERGEFTVPDDAVIYNQTQGWIAENAGKTAKVKVAVTCDFGEWHNGVKGNIDDLKYYIAFLYTWAYKDGADDPYYDESLGGTAGTLSNILGFQWTDNGYVVYGTYEHPLADDMTAGFYVFYPTLPWELYWAMGELVANAKEYGIDKTYSFSSGAEGVLWLDLLTKEHVDDLAKVMLKISGLTWDDITKTTTTQPPTTTSSPSPTETTSSPSPTQTPTETTTTTAGGTSTTTYVVVGLVIIIIAAAAWYFTKKK